MLSPKPEPLKQDPAADADADPAVDADPAEAAAAKARIATLYRQVCALPAVNQTLNHSLIRNRDPTVGLCLSS